MDLIPIPGAEVYYDDRFLPPEEATQLFNTLLSKCAWERHRASFGHTVPRDEAYYGEPGTRYTYSRREYKPLPWIPELLSLKARVEEAHSPKKGQDIIQVRVARALLPAMLRN